MTLLKKFSIICFLVILGFAGLFSRIVASAIEESTLDRVKNFHAAFIAQEVKHEFSEADFLKSGAFSSPASVDGRLAHLSLGPDSMRIKVWSKDMVVLWSDEKRLIGRHFPDNEELLEALEGNIEAEFSSLSKEENTFEREVSRMVELYIPIDYGNGVVSVFEVYESLDSTYTVIESLQKRVYLFSAFGAAVIYLVLFGLMADASRRLKLQTKKIISSEERLRNLISGALNAIVVVDEKGTVVLSNDSASRIYGLSPDNAKWPHMTELFGEGSREWIREAHRRLLSGEKLTTDLPFEAVGLRPDGETFLLEISPSSFSTGNARMVTLIMQDVTEKKELLKRIIRSEKNATVAVVASSIGHELNNSATAMMGYAELLAEKPDDSRMAEKASEVFLKQTNSLATHARNLLDIGKPREPKFEELDLGAYVSELTGMLKVSGVLKHIEVVEEREEGIPHILGDREVLEQVFRNLEINAAQAMGNSGTLRISCSKESEGMVRVVITDDGPGIPDSFLPMLFEPFKTTRGSSGGTGLGMFIAKSGVELHGGTLEVESRLGVGTTILIRLPTMAVD